MATMLLEEGANPDDASAGYTALHAATLRGDATLVRSLLKYKANPNTRITRGTPLRRTSQDWELPAALIGATPYALAAKFLEAQIMRDLVAGGADPRIPLTNGTTPLMAAAGMGAPGQADRRGLAVLDGGKIPEASQVSETVAVTLALGSDVNATNRAGDTALHFAASQGYDAIVQMLVDSGAQINAKNQQGQTPLGLLLGGRRGRGGANAFVSTYAQSSHPTTVELLRKLGAVE
jgi:ankyrin repeat protein